MTGIKFSDTFRKTIFNHGYLLIIAAWLFTISFVISNYWAFNSTPAKVKSSFESYLSERENSFEKITTDRNSIAVLLDNSADKSSLKINDADFGLFIFNVSDSGIVTEKYWSTFNMTLNASDLAKNDGFYPFDGTNGFFELLKKTVSYQGKKYIVAALVPIKWKYFIENKYFTNSFANSSLLDNRYFIDNSGKGYPVYNSRGKVVFKISEIPGSAGNYPNTWSAILKIAATIFILIFIHSIINEVTIVNGFYVGTFWLMITIVLLRVITYSLPIPFDFRNYELFSPLIYASSMLNSSLGDLLINVLLFFWVVFFIKYRHKDVVPEDIPPIFIRYKKIFGAIALFLFAFFTLNMLNIVCSLVLDSRIPLNVTDFFHLNFYTVIAFIVLTFIILSYFNLSYFLFLSAINAGYDLLWKIAIVVASALFIISIQHTSGIIFMQLATVVWLILYCIILHYRKEDIASPIISSPYFLFWLMFFAASVTVVIRTTNSKEFEERKRTAVDIAMQADNEGENLLKMEINDLSNFSFDESFSRFYSPEENSFIKDSLLTNTFRGFLNKYESAIYTYDSLQQPLYNKDSTSFDALNAMIGSIGKQGSVSGLYTYPTENSVFNYIYRKKVISEKSNTLIGYLFIVINPKRFINSPFPTELLHGSSLLSDNQNPDYSYAVYKNRTLSSSSNDYDFSDSISVAQAPPVGDFRELKSSKAKELWYNPGNNLVVVLAEKNNNFIASITLFAYLFLSFVVLIVLFKIIGFVIQSRFRWDIIKQAFEFKIRFQIHATIIFISLFSFIVIGISTISFFIMRFDKSNQEVLTQNLQVLANEIQESLKTELPLTLQTPDELDNFYSSDLVEKRVIELANLNNDEVNLYDKNGTLQASSQPYIYNQNIVSNKMQPDAYYQMRYKHRINYLQEETIGKFQYLSGYVPLYDRNKNAFGYLNIPFLHSQSELQQEISSFMVTVINLNALIFLLAGAIAALLTLRITKSFSYIKEEMSKINVGIENKALDWKRNDEIGDLVKEYNIMVQKLNESIKALAQSEREGAWKEMARQVAHEIKNPLTPMKLSLQFLQRSAHNETANIRDLSQRIPTLLIEQIDQLARIASDFSQFANIHNVNPETFNLSEMLASLVMLNNANDEVNISFEKTDEPLLIYADKVQINRVFTNLIKNAIEATEAKQTAEIHIKELRVDNNVLISVQDNGQGISVQQASKIFEPNFTTKSSGTGLGLAICKGIVEKAGGQIWFESDEGEGTTFFVSLPLEVES
ncbi:hypothetical protein A9P82_00825 [Arachidicoccus ginsenosidimutans]|uniref:ATP-binding protein n=1 Tax=Arachidicoccus sp. BS20 TaxID=1850526 RepID=UPI0007F10D92|nr:ATP-binding protein [Arachidicoccus sp. BS20]ANI87987.1 hypothetical protein A9P82_00825 [Arachidicoccus sp. BS20]